jgi:hypothetical protein
MITRSSAEYPEKGSPKLSTEEVPDHAAEVLGLVEIREVPGPLEHDEARIGDKRLHGLGMRNGHGVVLVAPDEQGGRLYER